VVVSLHRQHQRRHVGRVAESLHSAQHAPPDPAAALARRNLCGWNAVKPAHHDADHVTLTM
jgi:hypothetical protein